MSKYAVMPMTDYEGICNAVRAKTGGTAKLKSSEVKQEIEGIQTGSDPVVQPLTVTENGTYTAPDGVDGYNPVTVNVAASGGDAPKNGIVYTSQINGYPAGELFLYGVVGTDLKITQGQYITAVDSTNVEKLYGKIALDSNKVYDIRFSPKFIIAGSDALTGMGDGSTITFTGKPTMLDSNAFKSTKKITINVPWAEGEVANVPWGATNATINYNYTGG